MYERKQYIYTLFPGNFVNRVGNKLNVYQPVEQAAFRKRLSICHHQFDPVRVVRKFTNTLENIYENAKASVKQSDTISGRVCNVPTGESEEDLLQAYDDIKEMVGP